MNIRQLIPVVLLVITFFIWSLFTPPEISGDKTKYLPSYVATNVKNVSFDDEGDINYIIFSKKVTKSSTYNSIKLIDPVAVVYLKNGENEPRSAWEISSKEGEISNGSIGKKLLLSAGVEVENLTKDQLIQTMETNNLTFLIDKKELSTDEMITWKGPQMTQTGVGMWASLVTEEFKVKNKIEAVYLNEKK